MSEALQELSSYIGETAGGLVASADIAYGELTLKTDGARVIALLTFLRDDVQCGFVNLVDICGVDWPARAERFDVVYHLLSPRQNLRIRVKVATGYSGLGYLIAAHTAFCIPFAYLPIRARLESMDLTLERAAADLYASSWQAFRYVTLPLLRPAIIAGFMLAFVISLDDVVITEFVKSGGQDTLPTYMLGQLRRETSPEINAIATVFLALSTALVVIFFFINRKKQ